MGFFVFDDKEDYFKNNTSIFHNKYFKDNTSFSFMTKKIPLKTILLSFTTSTSKTKKITSKTILLSFTSVSQQVLQRQYFFVFHHKEFLQKQSIFHNKYFKDNTSLSFMTKKISLKTILLSFTTLHNKYFKDFFVFDEEDYFKSNTFTTFHNTYFKDNTSSKISETQTTIS